MKKIIAASLLLFTLAGCVVAPAPVAYRPHQDYYYGPTAHYYHRDYYGGYNRAYWGDRYYRGYYYR